jgi:hypothetical protein
MMTQQRVVDDTHSPNDSLPLKCRWIHNCSDDFPRTASIFCGILLPLLFLEVWAIVCGYWLARIENPHEIEFNDAQLCTSAQLELSLDIIANFTALTPRICWLLYLQQKQQNNDSLMEDYFETLQGNGTNMKNESSTESALAVVQELQQSWLADENIYDQELSVSSTDIFEFMVQCGNRVREAANNLTTKIDSVAADDAPQPLTFQWNRCTPYNNKSMSSINETETESLQPVRTEVVAQSSRCVCKSNQCMRHDVF